MTAIGSDRVGSVYTAEDYSTTEPETEVDKFSDDECEPSQDLDIEKQNSPPPDLIHTSKYSDVEIEDDPESPRQLLVAWESDIEPNSQPEEGSLDPYPQPLYIKALCAMGIKNQELTPSWRTNNKPHAPQNRSGEKKLSTKQHQYDSDLSPDSPANVFLRFGSRDSF